MLPSIFTFASARRFRAPLAASIGLLVCSSATAETVYWDATATSPDGISAGGSGPWDLTNVWDTGTAYLPWNNLGFDTAVFGGTSGTVSVNGMISAGGLDFRTSDYSLTGGTLTLGGAAPAITVASGSVATIRSTLTGTDGVTKAGAGVLSLTANNSNLSSGLTISAGEVNFSHANALGSGVVTLGNAATGASNVSLYINTAAARIGFNGSILVSNNIGGTATIGSLASSSGTGNNNYFGNITLQRDVIFDSNAADRTDYRNITGTGNITVTGTGRSFFTSTSANTFVGNLTVATSGSGNLQIGSNSPALNLIPDTAELMVNAGSKLVLSTVEEAVDRLSGAGVIDTNSSLDAPYFNLIVGAANGSATFAGTLADGTTNRKIPLALTKTGSGTQVLTGVNTYTGPTTVQSGILQINSNGMIGSSPTTIHSGATLKVTGSGSLLSNAVRVDQGGILDVSGTDSVYSLESTQTLTIAGQGGLGSDVVGNFKVFDGTLAFGSSNSFGTGKFANDLTLDGGKLVFKVSTAAHDQLHVAGNINVTFPTTIVPNVIGQSRTPGSYPILTGAGIAGAADLSVGGLPDQTRETFTLDTTIDPNSVSLVITGSAMDLTWTGQASSTWDVGGASDTNWKKASNSEKYYNLDRVTFDDTATNKLVYLSSTLNPDGVRFNNSEDYTLTGTGSIMGSTSLVKQGSGRVFVDNTNLYTGPTIIVQGDLVSIIPTTGFGTPFGTGTIQVGDATTGEGNTAALRLAGATDLNQPIVVPTDGTGTALIGTYGSGAAANATIFQGPISLGRATTFEATTVDQLLISGKITGTPGLITIQGTGRTTFSNADNNFTGDVQLRGTATFQLNNGTSLRAANSVDVGPGTTLQLYGGAAGTTPFNYTINALTGSGTVRSYTGNSLTLTVGAGGGSGAFSGRLIDYNTGSSLKLSLTKSGTGTQTLSGIQNSYTGATVVTGGTLLVSGSLSGTTSVTVNSAGRLEFEGPGNNHINDAATFTLAGGTLAPGGSAEGDEFAAGLGALRLTASSILDFAEISGSGLLHFADSSGQSWGSAKLSIHNWGVGDRLFFGSNNFGLALAQLGSITFYSDAGFTALGGAQFVGAGSGEITVVPEPSAFLTVLGAAGILGMRRRRAGTI